MMNRVLLFEERTGRKKNEEQCRRSRRLRSGEQQDENKLLGWLAWGQSLITIAFPHPRCRSTYTPDTQQVRCLALSNTDEVSCCVLDTCPRKKENKEEPLRRAKVTSLERVFSE